MSQSYKKLDGIINSDNRYKTIQEFLRHRRDNSGDDEAFIMTNADGERVAMTWNMLWEKSHQVAYSLKRMGVQKGEYVALYMNNFQEWIYIAFGTILSGACLFGIQFVDKNWDNIVRQLNKLERCRLIIFETGENGQAWHGLSSLLTMTQSSENRNVECKSIPYLRYVVGMDTSNDKRFLKTGLLTVEELFQGEKEELPESLEDDPAICNQSSGSTGPAKMSTKSHKNILTYSRMHYSKHKVLVVIPLSRGCRIFRSFVSGSCYVFVQAMSSLGDAVDTESLMKIICEERCVSVQGLSAKHHYDMIKRKDSLPVNWPVKHLSTAGSPLNRSVIDAIGKLWSTVGINYSSIEVTGSWAIVTHPDQYKEFYCGKLTQTYSEKEMKIVDESGNIVPRGQKGEIYFRSEDFEGYVNDSQKTAKVLTSDGWFKTDDIGMFTENDDLYVYGRKSNIINAEGTLISPELLEEAIEKYPGVANVVVVPVRSDIYNIIICACVYLKQGADVTEEQLRGHCLSLQEQTPYDFKELPRLYMFLDTFPFTFLNKQPRKEMTCLAEKVFSSDVQ